jgi:Fe(3+) dicitrate transport protein
MTVTLGARAEWVPVASGRDELGTNDFDDRFFAVLPGADASYELSDWCAVYANAHESFRAPQVWGFNFSGADQDLDFEKGRSFEGGTRVRAPHGVSGSAAVWRVDFDDVATFDKGYYDNFGRIVAEGVDFVAAWDVGEVIPELRGFSVQGSWTHQVSELREGAFRGNATPYAWDDKAAVSARWQRDGWLAALDWTYFGSTWSDEAHSEEDPTGFVGFNRSVSSFDARLSKSLQLATNVSVDLGVGVTNLFDTERFVHSRGGFFGGGRVAYAPRQVYVSAGFTANF